MAYEKNTWASGDVVTSAKLNHMEDGIAEGGSGGTPIINTTRTVGSNNSTVFTFDKTFAEVKAMLDAGQVPVVKCVYESNGTYFNPVRYGVRRLHCSHNGSQRGRILCRIRSGNRRGCISCIHGYTLDIRR